MTLTAGIYADAKVQTAPYLSPMVGTVTSPDPPGVWPPQCIMLCRIRGPFTAVGSTPAIASQRTGSVDRSWVVERGLGATGTFRVTMSSDGASVSSASALAITPVSGGDEEYAVAMTTGATRTLRMWQRIAGTWTPNLNTHGFTALTPFDTTAPIRIGAYGSGALTGAFDGRIYYAELRTGLDPDPPRAALNFPNLATAYLTVSADPALDITGDIEIVIRANVSIVEAISHCYISKAGSAASNRSWQAGYYNQRMRFNWSITSAPTVYGNFQPNAAQAVNTFRWLKWTRTAADGIITQQWAADQTLEPPATSPAWAHFVGSPSAPGALNAGPLVISTAPLQLGIRGGLDPGAGQLRRAIIRKGINGPVVFDFDDVLIPSDSATTFKAHTGQTLTVTGDPLDAVTSDLIWRFDASEYPGSGLSYVDPRGRTWTLDNAGAIVRPT